MQSAYTSVYFYAKKIRLVKVDTYYEMCYNDNYIQKWKSIIKNKNLKRKEKKC